MSAEEKKVSAECMTDPVHSSMRIIKVSDYMSVQ